MLVQYWQDFQKIARTIPHTPGRSVFSYVQHRRYEQYSQPTPLATFHIAVRIQLDTRNDILNF